MSLTLRARLVLALVLALLVAAAVVESPKLTAKAESALTAKYDATQVKDVQRNPAWPPCVGDMTVSMGSDPYSGSAGIGGGTVDLNTVVAGGAYLKLFKSGDPAEPWGISMFQVGTDEEVKWDGTAWVLPGDPNYGTAEPYTQKGQAYGLYSGGFLHVSSPGGIGTFMLIGQSWPGADTLTYTPDPPSNDCIGGRFVAKESAMDGGGAAPAPEPTWTLTYNTNGGTCSDQTGSAVNGSWLTLPGAGACTRPGFEFVGWNTSVDGSGLGFAPGGATLMSGDNTLYAQWKAIVPPKPAAPPTTGATTGGTTPGATDATTTGGAAAVPARKVAKMVVRFGAGSAELTAESRARLRDLVRTTGTRAERIKLLGYVQRSGSNLNDLSLSTARARVVGEYLRSLGMRGDYYVLGDGIAGPNPADRRTEITVTFTR